MEWRHRDQSSQAMISMNKEAMVLKSDEVGRVQTPVARQVGEKMSKKMPCILHATQDANDCKSVVN